MGHWEGRTTLADLNRKMQFTKQKLRETQYELQKQKEANTQLNEELEKVRNSKHWYRAFHQVDEENARLREALEFYADENKYECDCLGYDSNNKYYFSKPEITEDYGQTAQKALGVDEH